MGAASDSSITRRIWVQKYEAGALDEDAQAADLLQEINFRVLRDRGLFGASKGLAIRKTQEIAGKETE